jgi:4a-hydroxytetrahydrobiopterin dehydratase
MNIIELDQLQAWLSEHPNWVLDGEEIIFDHRFKNFVEAFGFLSKIAILAEKYDHHPTIINTYAHLRLSMTTHDAGNKITDRDLKLAEAIEELI